MDEKIYSQAKKIIERNPNCSISYLQRTLHIGYNRATELIKAIQPTKLKEKNTYTDTNARNIAILSIGDAGEKIVSSINNQKIKDIKLLSLKKALIQSDNAIATSLKDIDLLFLVTGLGGETGSTVAPLVTKIAKELKIVVCSIVTMPFSFEGQKREKLARKGLLDLKKYTDSIFVIENNSFLQALDKTLGLKESFEVVDNTIAQMIINILNPALNSTSNHIDLDFNDIYNVLSHKGLSAIGISEHKGKNSVVNAINSAIEFPLFKNINISDALCVLIIVRTHPKFQLSSMQEAIDVVDKNEETSIIFTTSVDASLEIGYVQVTVVATGFEKMLNKAVNNVM